MVVEVSADFALNPRDLGIERFDHLADRSLDDSRLGRLLVDRLLDTSHLEMLVMTHKRL
jgi:hypothetical protein